MVNVIQYPYFSFDDLINPLLQPLYRETPINLLAFKRCFPNLEQILVTYSSSAEMVSDIYSKEFYRYGYFTNDPQHFESGFHMWDYLNLGISSNLSHFLRDYHGFAHGITIIQQHGKYCDFFIFGTSPDNCCINNFYLNKKDMFTSFIQAFYEQMATILEELAHHKLCLPMDVIKHIRPTTNLSTRQLECGDLLLKGKTSKEIAKILHISHRTVEYYIDILKQKSGAKNRAQLTYFISKSLQ
jgi:DNA-binding CsgD family transcriptional regulator